MRLFTMRMSVVCTALLLVAACGDDDPAPAATPTTDVVDSDATSDATEGDAIAADVAAGDTAMGDTAMGDTAMGDTATGDTAMDDASMDDASMDDASMDDASMDDASMDDASMDDASMDDASMDDASMDDASMDDASMDDVSMDDVSMDDAGPDEDVAAPAVPTWDGAVQAIIAANCGSCHGSSGGWSSNSYADSQKTAYSGQCGGMTKGECYSVRIKDGTMPNNGTSAAILAEMEASGDLETLDAWIADGMPEN